MSEYVFLLLTFLYKHDKTLLKCAFKTRRDSFNGDCLEYPMEPENRKQILNSLPDHLQQLGDIVDVNEIYDIAFRK